ncbi:J domain-containing protein [Chroococcus sp. FPU101]|uniref:J domain-containing protein n=1 Tax=Chroococcus sp. FPU101 TaxID=1974212 RepID=UPI001A8CB4F3|nr:J domain-containing protein [Chroococcus sp. FPU101]GFE69821.1 heat shock protein DnaJ domain protein [Chroococcus sp. FPU101]
MTQERSNPQSTSRQIPVSIRLADTYYGILGVHPSASAIEIRRAYRELSKQYHPDTTELAASVATAKFQRLNEAYGTLSNPERRTLYDLKIGYSRINVIQAPPERDQTDQERWKRSAYLDPTDRPLSGGEIFALFIMGITLAGCLLLAIAVAILRGDSLFPVTHSSINPQPIQERIILVYSPSYSRSYDADG